MEKERAATERRNAETILEIFAAIERRDDRRMAELVDPDFEIHWPLSLPYMAGAMPQGAGARK